MPFVPNNPLTILRVTKQGGGIFNASGKISQFYSESCFLGENEEKLSQNRGVFFCVVIGISEFGQKQGGGGEGVWYERDGIHLLDFQLRLVQQKFKSLEYNLKISKS